MATGAAADTVEVAEDGSSEAVAAVDTAAAAADTTAVAGNSAEVAVTLAAVDGN